MKATGIYQQVDSYLTLRSSLGFRVNSQDRTLLQGFAALIEQNGRPITTAMALSWACNSSASRPATRAWRLSRLRGFLTCLRAFWPETEVPGRGLLAKVRRQTPYIYSEEQVSALLRATQFSKDLGPAKFMQSARMWRAHTFETLFGLLASTGLRVGEASRLDFNDVRLNDDPAHLLVRETKFRKTRVVPLHPSVADKLERFVKQRNKFGYHKMIPFFVSERGDRVRHGWISRGWRRLLRSAGVRPMPDGRRPTVHGLRHSFAVRRLLEWQRQGMNVTAWIPHLSVYMGHAEPQNTYWYLTATPELLSLAALRFELFAGGGEDQ